MFDKNIIYKFELPGKIFYTGSVVEEDSIFLKIITKFGEEKIINKKDLIQAWDTNADKTSGGER